MLLLMKISAIRARVPHLERALIHVANGKGEWRRLS